MKKLKTRKPGDAVGIEHPELGGLFYIHPMVFGQVKQYAQLLTKEEFDRDNGKIIFNPLSGEPVKKYAGDPEEHVDFAMGLLDRIEDLDSDCIIGGVLVVVDTVCNERSSRASGLVEAHLAAVRAADEDKGAKVKAADVFKGHRDSMRDIMTLMGKSDVEFEIDVDAEGNELKPKADPALKVGTKNVFRPVDENVFVWVTRESAKLTKQRNEVAKGN